MKKVYSLIAFIMFLASSLFAQIPNFSFETWSTVGTHTNPDSWGCLNDITAAANVYTCQKATNAPPLGTAYVKLTSKTVSGMGVVPGVMVCGTLNPATMKPKAGFPYTIRSQKLTGKWQHMSSSDQGYIDVLLSKWNSTLNKRDTVAYAHKILGAMAMSWVTFNITLTYIDPSSSPDSAMIFCSASPTVAVVSDYLWLDNLTFTGIVQPTGINDTKTIENTINIFPNPCHNNLNLSLYIEKSSQVIIQLYDVTGKMIKTDDFGTLNGAIEKNISVSAYPKGLYFLKIIAEQNSVVKHFVIE